MGPQYVVFLITFATFVSVNASIQPTFPVEDEIVIHSRQLVRTDVAVGDEHEERYPEPPYSKMETLKSLFTPKTISDDMFNRWLKNKKSVDKVFVRLNLQNTPEDKLLENPYFTTWINYAKALNAETGSPSWSTVSKLTEYYDDDIIARIIEAAKKTPGMEVLASDLHTQQFQYWLHFATKPEYVFRSLRLTDAKEELLKNPSKNPLFMLWLDYVNFYNKNMKNHQEGYLSTLGTRVWFDDDDIFTMVEVARKTPSTMEFAKKLRAEQVDRWFTYGWHPSKVWLYLRRDVNGKNVFASPEFKLLSTYVDRFNKKNPNEKTTVVSALNEYFRRTSTKAILAALRSKPPDISNKVETALIKTWLTKYDPIKVFETLNLHRSRTKLLQNPLLITWGKYVYAYNVKNPDKRTTPMEILREQFGDRELYKMLVKKKNVPTLKNP